MLIRAVVSFEKSCILLVLSSIYIGEAICQKTSTIPSGNSTSQIALATLGDVTQIGSFPFLSRRPRQPRQVGRLNSAMESQTFLAKNFSIVNEPLLKVVAYLC